MTQSNNESMRRLLGSLEQQTPEALDIGLARYLSGGLVEGPHDSLLSAESYKHLRADPSMFQDCTAFETFVNKINVDDWCSDPLLDSALEKKLAQAFLLADLVGEMASKQHASIAAIITVDPETDDIVFRFHREHLGEPPWLRDPEDFSEAISVRKYSWLDRVSPTTDS